MHFYIIRGWTKKDLSAHEFACREHERGNLHNLQARFDQATEVHFRARGDASALKLANKQHPTLTERRELLRLIPDELSKKSPR